ncbi:MAG: hypothetical protein N2508_07175 [Anaerolineae bacterium]|nr:hypothetical protein [Anaerolineae bacterium]
MESIMLTIKFITWYGLEVLVIALLLGTVLAGAYQLVVRHRASSEEAPLTATAPR